MTSNTNTHANLINNATNMQSHLLEFSHQMSNLSLKSLEDQVAFKMTEEPSFTVSTTGGISSPSAANSTILAGTYISLTHGGDTTYHRLTADAGITELNGNYDLNGKITPAEGPDDIPLNAVEHTKIKIHASETPVTAVTIQLNSTDILVNIGVNGVPSVAGTETPTTAVAKAMAVVGMHLKGIGLTNADVKSIFENGITPTSLAAAESQLKGHHDSVLQLSLEALSRVTSVLQKISQKLSQ
jgi:hypothetical protein